MIPAVSIIMPVRNAAPFLADCLNSIINQSFVGWELVAVDDGSDDLSLEILQSYQQKDDRIRVFNQGKEGIIPALRKAFAESKGTYITRMDADDLMDKEKIEMLLNSQKTQGSGHLSIGKVKYFHAKGIGEGYRQYANWLNGLGETGRYWNELFKECVVPSPSWMMHRKDLLEIGAFEPNRYPEDYDLCFRCFAHELKPIYTAQAIHLWRDHPNRSSRTQEHYSDNRFLDIKIHYFLKLIASHKNILLWGAGKKGKYIAKQLIEKEMDFIWLTNNEQKVGKDIFGKVLLKDDHKTIDFTNARMIIAIAGPDDQRKIKLGLSREGLEEGRHFFFFA